MTVINGQSGIQVCQVKNQLVPQEGPKSIPLVLDFATETAYLYDATTQQNLGYLSMVQTIWVDTSGMAAALVISIPGSRQTLTIPPNMNGFLNVLCPNPAKVQFSSSAGAGIANVQLINTPIAAIMWATV